MKIDNAYFQNQLDNVIFTCNASPEVIRGSVVSWLYNKIILKKRKKKSFIALFKKSLKGLRVTTSSEYFQKGN